MQLPVTPPVAPMLAKAVPTIPPEASYEPKWDGFRTIVFRDGDEVELGSRNGKPMTRYFPEIVDAVRAELPQRCVVDGEVVVAAGGVLDFEALQLRLHPARSRVELLAGRTPASFVAFDLLALGDQDLTGRPFVERRAALVEALAGAGTSVHLCPATRDRDKAQQWFTTFEGAGLDGVIAKPLDGMYEQDRRVMFKIKHTRTADCVLTGFRWHKASTPEAPLVGSLLLGLHDGDRLQHVGVVGSFTARRRAELVEELEPLRPREGDRHPWSDWVEAQAREGHRPTGAVSRWNTGKDLSFVPLRPERVLEVRYEHMEGHRFRHLAHFVRWREDRTPESCTYEQLEQPVAYALGDIVPGLGSAR
ncbi:ATP-dependent DNA ligase [Luteipulveratus flavus]|uniref:DNA ligase (ATP) n=1 Tax=Luteipulveratus flavus TaxID=3031728 RepID=A0ABT6CBI1_9MICO|nr:ATP-dependent DNA ligase [Luteipulveratus sp. YIM 133296]MDF8265873.1 ATP-dependent DNA ligase [Luteipulveratus sp. YIM 133296]